VVFLIFLARVPAIKQVQDIAKVRVAPSVKSWPHAGIYRELEVELAKQGRP
jgi:hypothetical protein